MPGTIEAVGDASQADGEGASIDGRYRADAACSRRCGRWRTVVEDVSSAGTACHDRRVVAGARDRDESQFGLRNHGDGVGVVVGIASCEYAVLVLEGNGMGDLGGFFCRVGGIDVTQAGLAHDGGAHDESFQRGNGHMRLLRIKRLS
ncbi:hypothetical protein D3C80_1698310 [compost metagenome]